MKHIIISGATGYIGTNLIKELVKDYKIYAIVRESSELSGLKPYLEPEQFIYLSDRNREFYSQVKKAQPNYLIHLAGLFIAEHSLDRIDDLLESNLTAAIKILDSVCQAGCKNIVNTGSYWQNFNGETYNPVNLYAAVKEAFSKIVTFYTEAMDCKCITLKLFDTYGEEDTRRKLLNIINQMREGETLDVSSCEQKVFFCHIEDVVRAYVHTLKMFEDIGKGVMEVYAVRDTRPVELKEVVSMLQKRKPEHIMLNFGARPAREREILNPDNIGTVLPGWECQVSLQEGIERMVKAER